jgi:nucleoside-diphosphate-sugar epimerase
MNITITGASGFLGNAIEKYLESKGETTERFRVRYPLSLSTPGPSGDAFLHCAGIAHAAYPDIALVYAVNHELAVQAARLAKARGYSHFIFLSTALVWNDTLEKIDANEDNPLPNTEYGKAKLAAEHDIMYLSSNCFSVSVVRLPLVYGPGVKGNLARLIDAVARWPVCPLGYRHALRSVTGVATLNRFVEHLIRYPESGIYTLIETPKLSTLEMVRLIADALPNHGMIVPLPDFARPLFDRMSPGISKRLLHSRVINDQSVTLTGFDPTISEDELRHGLAEMTLHRYLQTERKNAR